VASIGNTLGSLVNWFLGRYIESYRGKRWFPFNDSTLEKAQKLYGRFGKWMLLLSWTPVVGDPLTIIAGIMRLHWLKFLAIVAPAKAARYLAILWLIQ
jgi:membrane protein YqaA with SNARE-associated domain